MILSNSENIKEYIVEILANAPYMAGPEILKNIQAYAKASKPAFYSALRILVKDEVVAKTGQKYFLSNIWLEKMRALFSSNEQQFVRDAIFDLRDGESIRYSFPSLLVCDTYWAHLFSLLIRWTDSASPICIWNPHQWFIIGRSQPEQAILDLFVSEKKHGYYTIGGNTDLDKLFKRQHAHEYIHINTGESFSDDDSYYLNIFGDFIVEVYLDEKLTKTIKNFFNSHRSLDLDIAKDLEKIISEKFPVKMKLSRNKKKADILRKKLTKDFLVK